MEILSNNTLGIFAVISFIVAIFGLYAVLVRVKEAHIAALKNEINSLQRQCADPYELETVISLLKEKHDLLIHRLMEAHKEEKSDEVNGLIKLLEKQESTITELLQDSEKNKNEATALRKRIAVLLEDYEPLENGLGKDLKTGEKGVPIRFGNRDYYL